LRNSGQIEEAKSLQSFYSKYAVDVWKQTVEEDRANQLQAHMEVAPQHLRKHSV
jgi:hypothetical protein